MRRRASSGSYTSCGGKGRGKGERVAEKGGRKGAGKCCQTSPVVGEGARKDGKKEEEGGKAYKEPGMSTGERSSGGPDNGKRARCALRGRSVRGKSQRQNSKRKKNDCYWIVRRVRECPKGEEKCAIKEV